MASPVTGNGTAVSGLGGPAGYGELVMPRADDAQWALDLSAVFEQGFRISDRSYSGNAVWLSNNGVLSFGTAQTGYDPQPSPRFDQISVFWADIDTRLRGEGRESGQVYVDIDAAADVVSITWDQVGRYRYDADQPNRFQLQLYDRGQGDFDIVFRYEQIGWSTTAGGEVRAAWAEMQQIGQSNPQSLSGLTLGYDLSSLPQLVGNTGQAGLWLLAMRHSPPPGPPDPPPPEPPIPPIVPPPGPLQPADPAAPLYGGAGSDRLVGSARDDVIYGGEGADFLRGLEGTDVLYGGFGPDTLNGGAGHDTLYGGPDEGDLRDLIYGGDGNDWIYGGAGNDDLQGNNGHDQIFGGLGADTLIGHSGKDSLSGGGGSDLMFGNEGADFLNGGFGHDRLSGGAGADRFYHLGIRDHGSDWIQDYSGAEKDLLVFGQTGAKRAQFQVNFAHTPHAGSPDLAEAFVIYRPTGQVIWALVDGAGAGQIWVDLGAEPITLLG